MTKEVSCKSAGANSFSSHPISPASTHAEICELICGAMMRTRACACKRPGILPAAMLPPPTTTTSRPFSFTNMGKRLIVFLSALTFHAVRYGAQRDIALDSADEGAGQE